MTEPQRIFIPCELFSVRAVLGPASAPTPLEQFVLRAVHSGADSMSMLERVFAIGHRPMLRLLLDLLDRSLVVVNLETGHIRLTAQAAQAVEEGRLGQLEAIEREEERIVLMHDLVAGTIERVRRRPGLVRSGGQVPAVLEPRSAIKSPHARILRTVRGVLQRRTTRAGRPLQVLEVAFELPGTASHAATGELRYLELHVHPELDEASGYVRVSIVFPDDLGAEATRALEHKLTQLVNVEQPSLVFKNLREHAATTVTAERHALHQRVADVTRLLERLRAATAGTYGTWQESLWHTVASLEAHLEYQRGAELRYEPVGDTHRQVEMIQGMVRSAQRQIVLACPFLSYHAATQFRVELEDALRAGRTIFLLAGMGETFELEAGLGAWFSDLKTAFPDRFFFSRRSANCHAKFVVVDACDVLVTSYNFMSRRPDAVFELGLRIQAAPAAEAETTGPPVSHIACELLRVAREIFPDYEDAQRLIDRPPEVFESGPPPPTLDGPPAYREDIEDGSDPNAQQQAALWKHRWERYVAALVDRVASLGTASEMVRDAEHRQLLYDALRTARHHVAILSDQLSLRAVNRRFLDELEQCMSRNVRVLLVYRRGEPGALDALAQLAGPDDDSLQVRRVGRGTGSEGWGFESHAKFLVCDDWAVITSFNFLSFAGDYSGAERHDVRTEVGMLVYGTEVISRILQTIVAGLPELASVIAAHGDDRATPAEAAPSIGGMTVRPARDVSLLLDEIKNEADQVANDEARARVIGRSLSRWFHRAQDADAAFSELADLAIAEPPYLIPAIAACLDAWPDWASPEAARHWYGRLIEHTWWIKRDPHAVVVLLAAGPEISDRSGIPPAEVAVVAGRYQQGSATASAFDEIALSCSEEDARHAVAAMAIPAVFFRADPPVEALRLLSPQLRPALRSWAEAALGFRLAHPEGLSELELEGLVVHQQARDRADDCRTHLVRELERSLGLNLDFRLGQLTWARITGGPFGLMRLQEAAKTSQLDVARQFLTRHGTRDGDIERMLDEAVREAGSGLPIRAPAIIGKRRRLCLDHLSRIVRAAKGWVERSRHVPLSRRLSGVALAELAETLRLAAGDVEGLADELRTRRAYPSPLVDEMRARMARLLELGPS